MLRNCKWYPFLIWTNLKHEFKCAPVFALTWGSLNMWDVTRRLSILQIEKDGLESHFHEGLYYRNEKVRAEKVGNNNKKEQGTFCFEKGQLSYRLPQLPKYMGARRQKWTQILKVFKNCGFLEKERLKTQTETNPYFSFFLVTTYYGYVLWNM